MYKSGFAPQAAAYDAYGDLSTDPEAGTTASSVAYGYDALGRTVSITPSGGATTAIALDALGRPWTRTTGSSVDTYSYAGTTDAAVRVANAGGSGQTLDSVVGPSGGRLGTRTGATVAWLLPDLHGDVAGALSQAGTAVAGAVRYDGYGQTEAVWPSGGTAATSTWRYQGRLDLSPTSAPLYAMGARGYSPGLGAFTSLDSISGSAQDPGQLNRFLYAAADPATLVDPTGHKFCTIGNPVDCDGYRPGATAEDKAKVDAAYQRTMAAQQASTAKWAAYFAYRAQLAKSRAMQRAAAATAAATVTPFNPDPARVNPGASTDYTLPQVRIPALYYDTIITTTVTANVYVNGNPDGIDVAVKPVPGSSALAVTSGDVSFSFSHDLWTGDAGPLSVTRNGKSVSPGAGLDSRLGPVATRTSGTLGISPSGQVMPASMTLTSQVDLNGIGDVPPTRIQTTIDTRVTYELHPERPGLVAISIGGVVGGWMLFAAQACADQPAACLP